MDNEQLIVDLKGTKGLLETEGWIHNTLGDKTHGPNCLVGAARRVTGDLFWSSEIYEDVEGRSESKRLIALRDALGARIVETGFDGSVPEGSRLAVFNDTMGVRAVFDVLDKAIAEAGGLG